MITRLRLDAALYEPAPVRLPGTMGRPRLKGKRLPNLEQILLDTDTQWSNIILSHWYGEIERQVEITALHHHGMVEADWGTRGLGDGGNQKPVKIQHHPATMQRRNYDRISYLVSYGTACCSNPLGFGS